MHFRPRPQCQNLRYLRYWHPRGYLDYRHVAPQVAEVEEVEEVAEVAEVAEVEGTYSSHTAAGLFLNLGMGLDSCRVVCL